MRVLSGRFLLGSVAALTMMSGAQAADMPVKAKKAAVEYVKVCSLYGAGYYYIPGTDTCLKIGGHIRVDMHWGPTAGAFESVHFNTDWEAPGAIFFNTKTRAYATFDARSQTKYGTLRSYFITGFNIDNHGGTGAYTFRGFIQLAGFTWGLAASIFDAFSITPIHLNIVAATNGSVGATGVWQWRYTAQFGNGVSASIAVEDPRRRDGTVRGAVGGAHAGDSWPDVLGQIQASGSWGRFQVAAAVRDATAITGATTTAGATGWAAMAGGLFRVPNTRDTFGFQVAYAEGAVRYLTGNANVTAATGFFALGHNGNTAVGLVADGLFSGGIYTLSTGWSFEAGYEHVWSPELKTSIAGGMVDISYTATGAFCPAGICDTRFWNIGSRTQWTPVPNFGIGLDVLYTHIDDAAIAVGAGVPAPYAGQVRGDVDVWTAMIRVFRNFWP